MTGKRGFTLLEVLVATAVLAFAISGVLAALSTSMRNAARLTDYDRMAMLARRKMEELVVEKKLPRNVPLEGSWDASLTGGRPAGWRARIAPWELPPSPGPGAAMLDRIVLEVWWGETAGRRTLTFEGFRRGILTPADVAAGALLPQ
jgi:type II secretion system protein I